MILKKGKSCIIEIIIFLFRYKNFAIHGKQIGMSVVHEILFGGSLIPQPPYVVGSGVHTSSKLEHERLSKTTQNIVW